MMFLPNEVRDCLDALEHAGFPTYAVGGCVRDAVLGKLPQDYDLCTAALPPQIRSVFADRSLVLAGEKHGTVGVVTEQGVVEITTFRTEGDYRDNRHPGWVAFVPHIEEDLARRDFTVNAMAYSPSRGFADPFGGREDLKNRVLRAVGCPETRFREDALRILRGVRFASRYGLTPELETAKAMVQLSPLMDNLARERVFDELCKLLLHVSQQDLLTFAPVLTAVIPELGPMLDFDQRTPHHAFDLYTHTAFVTAAIPPELPLRWAALLHDIGKVSTCTSDDTGRCHYHGHSKVSAQMADKILLRLKAPTALREQVVFLIAQHMTPLEPDRKLLRRRLSQYGETAVFRLLTFQEADFLGKGTLPLPATFGEIRKILQSLLEEQGCMTLRDLAINGKDLLDLGFPPGPEIGKSLNALLNQVLEETIPNTREALLAALQQKDLNTHE